PLHLHEPPRISLRLGIGPVGDNGLPALQLRGYENNRRLIAAIDLAEEPSGNGQRLRRQATNALLEWVALHVSSLARDPGHLASEACAN
ncbi:hypothetical protein CEJ63_27095, partial [Acinetobacter baumannii]